MLKMMVNKTKREIPNSNLVVLAAFSVNLFSQQIFQRSLSLLFSLSLSLRTRRQKKSFVAHHARPDDSDEEETLKGF